MSEKDLVSVTNDPVVDPMVMTHDQFRSALPKRVQGRISVEVMDNINGILGDSEVRRTFRDSLVSHTNVLNNGRFKLHSYIDAVKYVSYKLLGYNNQEGYQKTFPGRVTKLIQEGATEKTISAYVSAYNGNKLVNLILEQSLIPSWVLNAEVYQKAINTQAHLMQHSSSDKVRTDAANSLLNHLKPPETTKVELDIDIKDNRTIDELRRITRDLAANQKQLIESGLTDATELARSKLVINGNTGKLEPEEETVQL